MRTSDTEHKVVIVTLDGMFLMCDLDADNMLSIDLESTLLKLSESIVPIKPSDFIQHVETAKTQGASGVTVEDIRKEFAQKQGNGQGHSGLYL